MIESGSRRIEVFDQPSGDGGTQPYVPLQPSRPAGVTAERVVRGLLWIAGFSLLGYLLWYFVSLVVYLISGIVLAYLLTPLVDRFEGFGLGRIAAIMISFLLVFGTLSVLLTNLFPFIATQVTDLSQQVSGDVISQIAVQVEGRLQSIFPNIEDGAIQQRFTDVGNTLFSVDQITNTFAQAVETFTDIFYAVLVIPFVTFFFLKDGPKIRRSMLKMVPNRYFEVTLAVIEKVETNIGRYFRALLVQCLSVAIIASVLLYFVGLKYALAVGLFTGLANTIPYFGPLMGFLAGGLVSIAETGNFSMVFGVFIAMGITQVADNVVFQPFIFSRVAQTHPLLILFVVLIGAELAGIPGMLIAIPLLTTIRVGVEQVLWSLRNYRILRATR